MRVLPYRNVQLLQRWRSGRLDTRIGAALGEKCEKMRGRRGTVKQAEFPAGSHRPGRWLFVLPWRVRCLDVALRRTLETPAQYGSTPVQELRMSMSTLEDKVWAGYVGD